MVGSGNSEEVSEIQANCEDLGVFSSPSSSKSFKKQHTNVLNLKSNMGI